MIKRKIRWVSLLELHNIAFGRNINPDPGMFVKKTFEDLKDKEIKVYEREFKHLLRHIDRTVDKWTKGIVRDGKKVSQKAPLRYEIEDLRLQEFFNNKPPHHFRDKQNSISMITGEENEW